MKPIFFSEAGRMFKRSIKAKLFGFKKYTGSSEQICRQIIDDCFDQKRKYFMVSSGHFCEFYCRDFGWCIESLVSLGYKKKALQTLEYALNIFEKHGRVEQSISPRGKAFTFPNTYSADAIAFLVHALKICGAKQLANKHRKLIEKEADIFFKKVIDIRTGLVKSDGHFSSIKDYAIRQSSCYDNCMAGMLKADLDYLGFKNPLAQFDYAKILMDYYWTGDFFLDDLSGRRDVCGDASIFPFWCGIIKDKSMLKKVAKSMQSAGLTTPFPLKYVSVHTSLHSMIWLEKFAGNYERNAIWSHLGLIYIDVMLSIDKKEAKRCIRKYDSEIKKYKNFLEVYDSKGRPFKTPLYITDESMIWCANFLFLKKKLNA